MNNNNEKKEARRYNSGKNRYELISSIGLERLAEVYTKGAEKYTIRDEDGKIIDDGADNWRNGQKWMGVIASVQRHIEAWKKGEDIDADLQTRHLANAAWGLLTLLDFEKTFPQGDNRNLWYKKPFKRVWLDLDGVVVDFEQYFLKYLGLEEHHAVDWNDFRFREHFSKIAKDDKFWLGCPKLIDPKELRYPITGYCTARTCDNEIIKTWLRKNGFPDAELINVGHDGKKSDYLQGKCDIMVDDSIKNFVDLNSKGILCYLMTRPHNEKYHVGHLRCDNINEFFSKIID